jgi:hypothetical protein
LNDRNLAIEKAKSENRQDYTFTTGFIPGVGMASSLNSPFSGSGQSGTGGN